MSGFKEKYMQNILLYAFLIMACFIIPACGGGGGGAGGAEDSAIVPNAIITNDNANEVAGEINESESIISQNASTAGNFVGAVSSNKTKGIGIIELAAWQVQKIRENQREIFDNNTYASGVVWEETVPCDQGGTMTMSINDADNNDEPSAGDSLTIEFCDCGIEAQGGTGYMESGKMVMLFSTVTFEDDDTFTFGVSLTLNNLIMDLPDDYAALNGDMNLGYTQNGDQIEYNANGRSIKVTYSENDIRQIANYSMIGSSTDNMITDCYKFGGALKNSYTLGGTILFETTEDFCGSTADYSSSGKLVATGAKPEGAQFNSSLMVNVLNNVDVELSIDADGDGDYENQRTVPWAELNL